MRTTKKNVLLGVSVLVPCVLLAVVDDPAGDGFTSGNINTSAAGDSLALGNDNDASDDSIAVGSSNFAAQTGMAFGASNTASDYSVSLGVTNDSSFSSFALGANNFADYYSFAIGSGNIIESGPSFAIGIGNDLSAIEDPPTSGFYNFLIGSYNNAASADQSTLVGIGNYALGDYSFALGRGLLAQGNAVTVGTYNDPNTPGTKKFVVGCGADANNPQNALEVHADGTVIVNQAQGDISMGVYNQ